MTNTKKEGFWKALALISVVLTTLLGFSAFTGLPTLKDLATKTDVQTAVAEEGAKLEAHKTVEIEQHKNMMQAITTNQEAIKAVQEEQKEQREQDREQMKKLYEVQLRTLRTVKQGTP